MVASIYRLRAGGSEFSILMHFISVTKYIFRTCFRCPINHSRFQRQSAVEQLASLWSDGSNSFSVRCSSKAVCTANEAVDFLKARNVIIRNCTPFVYLDLQPIPPVIAKDHLLQTPILTTPYPSLLTSQISSLHDLEYDM